ncbi:hypothetical protein PYW08_010153 [Mythimna loreyi]|uniref:Uncharacterized protein n=1 Tax=Mythimna loreyi TaxID=667449 RepID=A0ACC2Q7F3_9NEOP|nr:hypothetical protein PYW08_010153 [Mythimna loreyi]
MQSSVLLCFAALVACSYGQVYKLPGLDQNQFFKDLHFERNAGRGKIFGTLGGNDAGLFGRGGYKADIFNDHRGRLQGQAYGERVLGAGGDSSKLGTKFDWHNANDNARASLDVHKEIGRGSGMTLSGDGVWKLDKNTRLVGGGNLEKNFGHDKPQIGLEAKIEHDF